MSEVSFSRNIEMPALPEGPELPQFSHTPHDRDRPPASDGTPRFFVKPVRMADGSYVNVEYVEILTPGDNKATPVHKVTERLKEKYAWHYDRWRRGIEVSREGIPIEMFPILDPAQVQMLKALNIFTVEDLCNVSDANLHRIPMGTTLRQSAVTWMKSKQETDAIEQQARENENLKSGMRLLEQQMQEMATRLAAAEAQKAAPNAESLSDAISQAADTKRGPGRPPKSKEG